jgi:hypothetical protein
VAPLLVPSGTEGNGADGTRCHGVVVFLVRLYVLTKLDATMFSVVDAESSDDGVGTESLRNAILVRNQNTPRNTISTIIRGGYSSKGVAL